MKRMPEPSVRLPPRHADEKEDEDYGPAIVHASDMKCAKTAWLWRWRLPRGMTPREAVDAEAGAAMERRGQEQIINTAHHEAGHVVASFVLGMVVTEAAIVPDEGLSGFTTWCAPAPKTPGSRREQRQIARAEIIICYAGPEAEWVLDPEAPYTGYDDEDKAFELSETHGVLPRHCSYVGDDAHLTYLNRLRGEARCLVRRHWKGVERVAASLLKHKRLNAKKLLTLEVERCMAELGLRPDGTSILGSNVSRQAKLVYAMIRYLRAKNGRCSAFHQESIARLCNMSERNVQQAIHELVKEGWVFVRHRRGRINRYIVNDGALERSVKPKVVRL